MDQYKNSSEADKRMPLGGESIFWKILLLFMTLLTVVVPAFVTYDLYKRGPAPEKKLELTTLTTNPLYDLSVFRGTTVGDVSISMSFRVKDLLIDNLVVVQAWLQNVGKVPILPSEYCENISVNVQKPWMIFMVFNTDDSLSNVNFNWNRVSETRFEASPALLNPNDRVSTTIYLTNTQFKKTSDMHPPVNVEWKTRIVNLPSITKRTPIEPSFPVPSALISLDLTDYSLLFTIVAAMLFLALYLHLLSGAGPLRDMRPTIILLVLGVTLLSFAAAESLATYLFGNIWNKIRGSGVDHWLNAPWIILNAAILILLYRKAKHRRNGFILTTGSYTNQYKHCHL